MNGQWIGPYSGTNNGLLVLDLDDVGEHYEGSASALDNQTQLPPTFADFMVSPIPKGKPEFELRVPLLPIDRASGHPTSWDELKKIYPDVEVPTFADTSWKVGAERIDISWKTDVGTQGIGYVEKSKGSLDSTLQPMVEIRTWEDFRKFTKDLEPYRYIFRGQTSNRWRLRTAFHRTGRASLVKFMQQDIPVLHRHLSGMMANELHLSNRFHNAAFYNLLQHHGYPTPLLDWTYSPHIAAYFAFKGVRKPELKSEDRIRVFVFDKVSWCKEWESVQLVTPPKLHFTVLEPLALNNPRVVPQQSVSCITNVDDIETYLARQERKKGKQYLRVIDLPAFERTDIMKELALMGITAGSLFPGIDGACEQVRERFFPEQ